MVDKSLKLSFELETFGRIYFQCGFFFLHIFHFTMRNEIHVREMTVRERERRSKESKKLTQAHPEIRPMERERESACVWESK